MTVSNTVIKQVYTGDGNNDTFAIPFYVPAGDEGCIKVYLIEEVDGWDVLTLAELTTEYTVLLDGDDIPVNILFDTPPTTEQRVLVIRSHSFTQGLDLINTGPWLLEQQEASLDQIVMFAQEAYALASRGMRFGMHESPTEAECVEAYQDIMDAKEEAIAASEAAIASAGASADSAAASAAQAAASAIEALAAADSADASAASALSALSAVEDAQAAVADAEQAVADATVQVGLATQAALDAADAQTAAETAQGLAEDAQAAAEDAQTAAETAQGLAEDAQAAAEAAIEYYQMIGTVGAPRTVAVAVGITEAASHMDNSYRRQAIFTVSATGQVSITANPQIQAGTNVGQEMLLWGTSDTDFITLHTSDGLLLRGDMDLTNGACLGLMWNGSVWAEMWRNN
jgi:hypothetical protein